MNYINCLTTIILIVLSVSFYDTFATTCIEGSESPNCKIETEADCRENEHLNSCGNLCEPNCDDIGPKVCPAICAIPACVCNAGYVRNKNDDCVLPEQCPPKQCPPHEYLKLCGRICEDTCANYGKPKICPRIACTNFTRNCSCVQGYVRNAKGVCVLPEKCPKTCPKNQTYTECGSSCPNTCNPRADAEIGCAAVCVPGCFCTTDYVTSKQYGCVLPEDCPPEERCFENEEYTTCGTSCPDTCDNYKNQDRVCTAQCVTGCFCKSGLVRNSEGKCIDPAECPPPKCGEHELYNECGTACPDTCRNLGINQYCIQICVPGCFCERGYVRSASGKCVLPAECPINETCTKPNEHINPSGYTNQRSCDNFWSYKPGCLRKEVCECDRDYVRDSKGLCVKPQTCPNLCGKNEKYDCGSACDTECGKIGEPCPIVNIQCNEKCYCIDGYARDSNNKCIPICQCPKIQPESKPKQKRKAICHRID